MPALIADIPVFASIAAAIFLEAAPFLLLGSVLAAALEVYAPPEALARLMGGSRGRSLLTGLLGGLLLPTCECGVVPITRRLMARGAPPTAAFAYMLAAPVINPVVLLSTWVAFQGDWQMVAARAGMVALPAAVMALVLGRLPAEAILGNTPDHGPDCACGCGHDHAAPVRILGPGQAPPPVPMAGQKLRQLALHSADEFLGMGKYLLLGCLAAAAVKTFLPAGFLQNFAGNPAAAVTAMMALAILLSVCSEADAFVAASLSTFPWAAQLSFMAIGPMVDLKLIAMFQAAFSRRVALALVIGPVLIVAAGCIALGVLHG